MMKILMDYISEFIVHLPLALEQEIEWFDPHHFIVTKSRANRHIQTRCVSPADFCAHLTLLFQTFIPPVYDIDITAYVRASPEGNDYLRVNGNFTKTLTLYSLAKATVCRVSIILVPNPVPLKREIYLHMFLSNLHPHYEGNLAAVIGAYCSTERATRLENNLYLIFRRDPNYVPDYACRDHQNTLGIAINGEYIFGLR